LFTSSNACRHDDADCAKSRTVRGLTAAHSGAACGPIAGAGPAGDGASDAGDAPMNDARHTAETAPPDQGGARTLDRADALSINIGIMLAMSLSALARPILAPALPTIGRALADVEMLSWVVTAYLI